MTKAAFAIHEHLGHEWRDELIGFPWEGAAAPAIVDQRRKCLPTQLADGKVWFKVDHLPADGCVRYRCGADAAEQEPCARARRDGKSMALDNGRVAIRVPASAACRRRGSNGQVLAGPVMGVRQGRGKWLGAGRFRGSADQEIAAIRFEVVEEGPLWCRYAVTYEADDGAYRVEYRLDVGAPYVRLAEHSSLCRETGWELDLYQGFEPSQAVYAHHSTQGRTKVFNLEYDGRQHLGDLQAPEQSIHYFPDDFDAFGFLNAKDYVGLCATEDGAWTYLPENPVHLQPRRGPKLVLSASCKAGCRRWLLLVGSAAESTIDDFYQTPIARARRKHETTLDWVKDLVLDWDEPERKHRPVFCTHDDLKRARRLFREFAPLKQYGDFLDRDAELVQGQFDAGGHYPLDDSRREDPVSCWLARRDAKTAAIVKRGLIEGIRIRVEGFLSPRGHRQRLIGSINLGRTLRPFTQFYNILGPHLKFTARERRWFRAAIAFLCYKVNDRNYWNAEALVRHSDHPRSAHRAAWFPSRSSDWCTYNIDTAPHNFHCDLYSAVGSAALAFPEHPEADRWLDQSVSYVEQELDNFVMETGAFIESATYTLAYLHWWVGFFAGLKNARRKNYFLDERFQRLCYALTRMQGPYDNRIRCSSFTVMGDAMYPSRGANVLAWIASLGRDDKAFAKAMMGSWERSGRQLNNPGQQGLSVYDAIYIDPSLPAKPVGDLPSEHMDGLGLLLRHAHGTRNEVYFFIKCGKVYSHFHYDEGTFFVFAAGSPLLDEYGVQYGSGTDENGDEVRGHMPRCHNGISFSSTPTDREGYNRGFVTKFIASDYADYAVCEIPVHLLHMRPGLSLWGFTGEEAPYGWWRRHILYIKPFGFFFHDELETEFSATLDLNFKADAYREIDGLNRVYQGRYGLDIPVCINQPQQLETRDGSIDMQANESSFAKFSTMESVDQEMKDAFYNQLSWHGTTGPGTDFNWAFAWGRPRDAATLQPLGNGAPGARLESKSKVTEAIVTPWLEPAYEYSSGSFIYSGWAGAATWSADGVVELMQLAGTRIGLPKGISIKGDGPFRATIDAKNKLRLDASGTARWLEVHGVDKPVVRVDGKRAALESAGRRAVRFLIPGGDVRVDVC